MNQLNLLVVDDSDTQREYALTLCREIGVSVLRDARNGALALDQLRHNRR